MNYYYTVKDEKDQPKYDLKQEEAIKNFFKSLVLSTFQLALLYLNYYEMTKD
jgi:hypothetical protein